MSYFKVYESIRVHQSTGLTAFCSPPDAYIPEHQVNLSIEEIATAYSHPVTLTPTATSHSTPIDNPAILDDSKY